MRFFWKWWGNLEIRLASKIPLPKYAISGLGRKPWFDVKGGIVFKAPFINGTGVSLLKLKSTPANSPTYHIFPFQTH